MSKLSITAKNCDDIAKAFILSIQHNERLLHVYKGKVEPDNAVAIAMIEDWNRQNELYKGIIEKINKSFNTSYTVTKC